MILPQILWNGYYLQYFGMDTTNNATIYNMGIDMSITTPNPNMGNDSQQYEYDLPTSSTVNTNHETLS